MGRQRLTLLDTRAGGLRPERILSKIIRSAILGRDCLLKNTFVTPEGLTDQNKLVRDGMHIVQVAEGIDKPFDVLSGMNVVDGKNVSAGDAVLRLTAFITYGLHLFRIPFLYPVRDDDDFLLWYVQMAYDFPILCNDERTRRDTIGSFR